MKQVSLRLPDDLHTRLVQRAQRNRRSLHSEIVYLLDQATVEQEQGR
jgi:plasmid stability protein